MNDFPNHVFPYSHYSDNSCVCRPYLRRWLCCSAYDLRRVPQADEEGNGAHCYVRSHDEYDRDPVPDAMHTLSILIISGIIQLG